MRCGVTWQKSRAAVVMARVDHDSGHVLAYVFGRRQDTVFLQLQKRCWSRLGFMRFYTDEGERRAAHRPRATHRCKQHTQKSRASTSICGPGIQAPGASHDLFSKRRTMHDLVIGLFINRYEFGLPSSDHGINTLNTFHCFLGCQRRSHS